MVDIAVTSQLQQWSFEKPSLADRPQRSSSSSSASSPNLCDDAPETLRIDASPAQDSSPQPRKESVVLQNRYMSSEEDLSPADTGSDSEYDYEDAVIHDAVKECKARTMSISRWDKGKSCDMAVLVSYSFVGRPKVVELDCRSPTSEGTMVAQRSASIAHLPASAIDKLQKIEAVQRFSMRVLPTSRLSSQPTTQPSSPPAEPEPRRPSTSYSPVTQSPEVLHLTDTASTASSFKTAPSSRSSTPLPLQEPVPSLPLRKTYDAPQSSRSSVYIPSQSRDDLARTQTSQSAFRHPQWAAPPTPASPAPHAFLSLDPYEASTANSASPIIKKPAAHKRLRSISMKLALAKIAISPAKKTFDSRVHGNKMPPTPSTPYTPMTPQTAPIDGSSSFASPNRLRRASTILRPKSRHGESIRGPSPDSAPPVPTLNTSFLSQKRNPRMVARGANEIEPTLVIPPCPSDTEDDTMNSIKSRKLKKRKSLMSLMDSL